MMGNNITYCFHGKLFSWLPESNGIKLFCYPIHVNSLQVNDGSIDVLDTKMVDYSN